MNLNLLRKMIEKILNNNIISYKKNKIDNYNNNTNDFKINESNYFNEKYSIEEIKYSLIKFSKRDISELESLRSSLALRNEELTSQILLDKIPGEKSPLRKSIEIKNNFVNNNGIKIKQYNNVEEEDYKLNEINANNANNINKGLDLNNNKIINIKTEEYYSSNDDSLYNKENEYNNNDTKKSINKNKKGKNVYEENKEDSKYMENKKILLKQNELFVQLLGGNGDNKNFRNKNIIISNLYEDLKNLTTNNESQAIQKNKKVNNKKPILSENRSLKNIKYKIINMRFKKNSIKKKSNIIPSFEKSFQNQFLFKALNNIKKNNFYMNPLKNKNLFNFRSKTKTNSKRNISKNKNSNKNNKIITKKNTINILHNLKKIIPILKRNKSVKSILEPTKFFATRTLNLNNNNYLINKKEKNTKFIFKNDIKKNIKYKKNIIPINNKKLNLNANLIIKNFKGNKNTKKAGKSRNQQTYIKINSKKTENNIIYLKEWNKI